MGHSYHLHRPCQGFYFCDAIYSQFNSAYQCRWTNKLLDIKHQVSLSPLTWIQSGDLDYVSSSSPKIVLFRALQLTT